MDNKVPDNGFLPIAVPVCSAVQDGESAAAAGERLHFNYGAGCRCGAAGPRPGIALLMTRVPVIFTLIRSTIARQITTQGTLSIFITFEYLNSNLYS